MTTAEPTKRCYRCWRDHPLSSFIQKSNGGTYGMCSACLGEILAPKATKKKTRLPHSATERVCYLCSRRLPNERFTRRSVGTYFSACKDCNVNVFAHRRRALLAVSEGSFTTAEWEALKLRYTRCPDCDRAWEDIPPPPGRASVITRDHVKALSRGGRNDIGNIRPLCYSCNSRKGAR